MTLLNPKGDPPPAAPLADGIAPLEAILRTEELYRRRRRAPDYEGENRALSKLVRALAENPSDILQMLADTVLETLKADSAGLSLLDDSGTRFYWPAIAGAWKPHLGGGTLRGFGPCGDVLDRDAPLLFSHWERRYPYLLKATPFAEEGLLVPFHLGGKAVGTIWAIAHNGGRKFDAEDLRQLESLGRFASAAYQAVRLQENEAARRASATVNENLRESERRLREMLEALPAAVYTTDAEGRLTFFNQAAVELSGRVPELGSDKWCVTFRLFHPDGTPMPHEQCPMAVALKEKRAIRGVEAVAERPDGTRVPFVPFPTPLFDAEGRLVGGVNMLVGIGDRIRAEEYARRLAAIVESSDDAIVSKDTNGIIQSWNEGAERLFGYQAEEVIGKPIRILMPPDRQDEGPEILARIRRGERVDHYETVRMRKDGSLLDISLTVSPLKDARGAIVGASKIARDITERKRAERHRLLLINELDHRVKNTIATVQSIAAQSFRGGVHADALKWFEGRLIALSRAQDVLTRENWESANLADIVAEAIAPLWRRSEPRFEVSGPPLRLRPKIALALAMALHELGTNAAKYGALSNQTGRVRIVWSVEGAARKLSFRWEEQGGPAVTPPRQHGFGTRLIERALARELGGRVRLTFPPSGAICEIEAPLA